MAWGRKRREIERLKSLVQHHVQRAEDAEENASGWAWTAGARRIEADRLSDALLAEHGRAELLSDAVFVALGYPEGAIERTPEVTR